MRSAPPPPLRIGLLLDSMSVPAWTRRMLERVLASRRARIELVVVRERARLRAEGPLRTLATHTRATLERRVIDAARAGDDAFAPVDIGDLLAGLPKLVAPRGDEYDDAEIEQIARLGLDVLLHLAPRPVGGRILEAARHGVWCHWSLSEPEGFWETAERRPVIRTALQRLTAKGAQTLYESTSSVDPTCVATNRNRAYWKTASFVPRALDDLHRCGAETFFGRLEPVAATRPTPRKASNAALLRFLAKRTIERRRIKWEAKIRREQWLLMFALSPTAPSDYRLFHKLIPPRDRFWADPHVLHRDGRYYIFLEEYLYATYRAHISVLVMGEDGTHGLPVPIIVQPYHMSYPHVFAWRGELYMVPETKANRTIEVYRCTEFPYGWALETRLMQNVAAVDATLLEHHGRWWLFANMEETQGASSWDELFLFSADSPLSATWKPHPLNPIVSDVTNARPAGRIFSKDGRLFRPSQNSAHHYGYGFNINEITELTESAYAERIVSRTEPTWDAAILATHTFAAEHGLTVIDGLRRCWRWP